MPRAEDLSVRESVVEKYLVSQLRAFSNKCIVKKIGGPGWRGWTDRLALHAPATAHWLEVKRPKGGKFEPLQLRNHRILRSMGFVVRVVNTKHLVDLYILELETYGPENMTPEPQYPPVDIREHIRTPRRPAHRSTHGV